MWWFLAGMAVVTAGVAGVYRLMAWDTHFLLLAAFGAGCGAAAGGTLNGKRGLVVGSVLGLIAPLAYVPVWFAFDLPPDCGIDL
jgi:hypothetical protein